MPYLSRIRINPLRSKGQYFLRNPQAMHAAVVGGVAGQPAEERVLWRVDADDQHRPALFVLTASKPDWHHLVEQAGWPDASGDHAVVRDYTSLLAQIAAGREFAFRLTANPVQNATAPQKPTAIQRERAEQGEPGERTRGFRVGHRTAAHQLDWFLQRTHRWGFEVPQARTDGPAPGLEPSTQAGESVPRDVRITARARRSFSKKGAGKPVVLYTVTFEGTLRVTDPAVFTDRLVGGIGPAKAYGCGLLTLAPLTGRPGG